jgi:hypothetical protein
VKTPDQIVEDVRRRLAGTWYTVVADELRLPAESCAPDRGLPWPHVFSLGTATSAQLEARFAEYQQAALAWRDWAASRGLLLRDAVRSVHGTRQEMPTHVVVPDIDAAAQMCGPDWLQRVGRARVRGRILREQFPHVEDLAATIRQTDAYSNVDFDLLVAAAQWFTGNSAAGLTPRQVPVPGLHAKWLNTRQRLVALLAGKTDLQLLAPHPPRIHFTYLDPTHRAAGGRRHDCTTVGDAMTPAYQPAVIVISENKDTALHFVEVPGGISVEGEGFGATAIASIAWVRACPRLFYWGDIDAAGFAILDGFRDAGLAVESLLMGREDYEAYERFGTPIDARGNTIPAGQRRHLPHLTDDEAALYRCLTDPAWDRYRRIEQEKIPLEVARHVLLERMQGFDHNSDVALSGIDSVVADEGSSVASNVGGPSFPAQISRSTPIGPATGESIQA